MNNVAIITINWNSWENTVECLESIHQINYPYFDVIVVDNASSDDSLEKLREYCEGKLKVESPFFEYNSSNKPIDIAEYGEKDLIPGERENFAPNKGIILIKNDENKGFVGGCNAGMKYALKNLHPHYILLLNNDTVVDPNFLSEMVRAGEENEKVGFIGPKIYFYRYNDEIGGNIIQCIGGDQNLWKFEPYHIANGELDDSKFDQNREVDFISGACMLAKTDMINEIGLLDEEFFSYREENDWCMRGYKAGWSSLYAYKSVIWHKGEGSTKELLPLIRYYLTRNRFLFVKKHARKKELFSFLTYFFLYDFWRWLMLSLFYRKNMKMINLKITRCYLKSVGHGLKSLVR